MSGVGGAVALAFRSHWTAWHHLVHGATAARPDVANLVKRDTVITLPVASWNVNAVPTGPQKTGSCNELDVGVADTDLADTCSAGA